MTNGNTTTTNIDNANIIMGRPILGDDGVRQYPIINKVRITEINKHIPHEDSQARLEAISAIERRLRHRRLLVTGRRGELRLNRQRAELLRQEVTAQNALQMYDAQMDRGHYFEAAKIAQKFNLGQTQLENAAHHAYNELVRSSGNEAAKTLYEEFGMKDFVSSLERGNRKPR